MKILLIAGAEHDFASGCLLDQRRVVIVNKKELALNCAAEHLRDNPVPLDEIVITDGGISANPDDNERELEYLSEVTNAGITVITRDFLFDIANSGVKVIFSQWFRCVKNDFNAIFNASKENEPPAKKTFGISKSGVQQERSHTPEEKNSKIRKWGSSKHKVEKEDNFDGLSVAASKAILFTGHRGAGATSTAVNVALSASRRGVNTILVDLDVDYRSINLYFGEFYKQSEEDECIESSLMRVLAQPQSYQTTAVNVESNLWLTSLGYDFNDKRLIEQHFTESKIIGLVSTLKHSFHLVVIDLPLNELAQFPSLLNSIDVIALCMENTIYSAVTTLRNIALGFAESERIAYLASKSRLVVTKYNDESTYDDEIITPERLSELIVSEGFCEDFTAVMPVAGSIPYINWFGKQIERDIPVMDSDVQMQKSYDGILLRLLGATR